MDYVCLCPPNHSGKDCRIILTCQSDTCHNGGTCFQTAYGARCTCAPEHSGDFCQYKQAKIRPKSNENLPHVEYKQFDAETLAVIASLRSTAEESSPKTNALNENLAIATGNRSQFVFCLTNPCENGGTCFVTNTATTKVRHWERRCSDWSVTLNLGNMRLSRWLCW